MTVNFKSPLTSQNTNDAYISRKEDSDTVGKIDLLNADSTPVVDVQNRINVDSARIDQNELDITQNENDITQNASDIAQNASDIQTINTDIAQNTTDIQTINDSKGQADGFAGLDSGGRVPESQLPLKLKENEGPWDASTNTPTLSDADIDVEGNTYFVTVAGTQDLGSGPIDFDAEDFIFNDGTRWRRNKSGQVNSVNGLDGDVTLDADNINETLARKYETVIHNRNATTDPTASNDSSEGYSVGSEWWNSTTNTMYRCSDNTAGLAVWEESAGSGSGGGAGSPFTYKVQDFEGDIKAANFSISGTATVNDETSNPLFGENSITISHSSGAANSTIILDEAIPVQQGQQNTDNVVRLATFAPTVGANAVYRLKIIESTDDVTYTDVDAIIDFEANNNTKIQSLVFKINQASSFIKFKMEIIQETTLPSELLIIDNIEFSTFITPTIVFDNITEWKEFTPPILQGLGAVSSDKFFWRRNGSNLDIDAFFITGTVTAQELQVGFPTEAGSISVDSRLTSRTLVGNWANNNPSADDFHPNVVGGDTFINLGRTTLSGGVASSIINNSEFQSFSVSIPIEEWSATGSGVVSEGQPTEPIIERFLTGNTTSVSDMADLTVTGLTVGSWYSLTGQISFYSANTNDCQVQYRSASGGNGKVYGRSRFDPEIGSGNTEDVRSLAFKFQATSSDFYVRMTTGDGNNLVRGDGTADQTYIQLEEINKPTAVISPFTTELVSGSSVETTETFENKRIKKFIYKIPSDITTTSTILSNPIGIVNPFGHSNYAGAAWQLYNNQIGSDNSSVFYDRSNGDIVAIIIGPRKIGAGTVIEMRYTE